MKRIGFVFITLLILRSTSLWAGESIDLKLNGQIVPSACMASFNNGGVIDYGRIRADSLSRLGYTKLGIKTIKFNINCVERTVVGFGLLTGRPGTLAGNLEIWPGFGMSPIDFNDFNGPIKAEEAFVTGIGLDSKGNKIGGIGLNLNTAQEFLVDGEYNYELLVQIIDTNFSWKSRNQFLLGGLEYAVGFGSSPDPKEFKTLSGDIHVHAYLNKADELDLSQEINLDGLVTFELKYL